MSRIVSDNNKCCGCLACVVTCIDHHYDISVDDAVSGRRYSKVTLPGGLTQYFTESCRHCKDAPCIPACPQKALHRDENGFVQVDAEGCIGCGACLGACPFNIPQIAPWGKMVKCDGCRGAAPACVLACPNGALKLVD